MRMQRYEDALQDFISALEIDPTMRNAVQLRTMAYFDLNRGEEAVASALELVQMSPDDTSSWSVLGDAYRLQERWNDALQVYDQALEVDPTNTSALFGKGIAYARTERLALAVETLDFAMTMHDEGSSAWNELARAREIYMRGEESIRKWRNYLPETLDERLRVVHAHGVHSYWLGLWDRFDEREEALREGCKQWKLALREIDRGEAFDGTLLKHAESELERRMQEVGAIRDQIELNLIQYDRSPSPSLAMFVAELCGVALNNPQLMDNPRYTPRVLRRNDVPENPDELLDLGFSFLHKAAEAGLEDKAPLQNLAAFAPYRADARWTKVLKAFEIKPLSEVNPPKEH